MTKLEDSDSDLEVEEPKKSAVSKKSEDADDFKDYDEEVDDYGDEEEDEEV